MKNFKKMMVTVLLLAGLNGQIIAYTFNITNKTGTDVQVRLLWGTWNTLFGWREIKSGATENFSTRNLYCLNGMYVKMKKKGRWQNMEEVKVMLKKAEGWLRWVPIANLIAESACGNKNFYLTIGEKTKKIVAIQK